MINFHSFIVGFNDSEYKKFKKTNPNIDENDLDNAKIQKLELFRAVSKIEKELIDEILLIDKKSRRLQFTQREVASEWVFTKSDYIDKAALTIIERYNSKHEGNLQHKGYDTDYNRTVYEDYKEELPEAIFVGKIVFK